MIVASAPGRCGVLGNPTDGYGGAVIAASLQQRARVQLEPAGTTSLTVCGTTVAVSGRHDLELAGDFCDVARSVVARLPEALERPFVLRADTEVPMRAGLAGSTAILIAILGAVLRWLHRSPSPYHVAELARDIEFEGLRVVCGFQDQYMAAFGGVNYLDFAAKDPHTRGPRVFATVEPLAPHLDDLPLLLANTGVQRHSGSVHGGLRERWIQGEPAVVEGYRRIVAIAREGKVALLQREWRRVGELMNENHAIQRDLGGSGEANERLIAAALASGAWGAKLAGAGKGGTIIALHEDPAYLAGRLEAAGATRILPVRPTPGLTVSGEC